MINALNGRYQKHIAWLLFLLFYGELAASLYAGKNYIPYTYRKDGQYYRIDRKKAISYYPFLEKPAAPLPELITEAPVSATTEEQVFIDGPGQPEMSSFRSVGADNMVNLFTGDFSYNIPLLDVGGYPVNLFYNAGISMDQEASWVGLGWNLNPGTISRNMRGLPDDFNEVDTVTNTQSMKSDLTIGVTGSKSKEFLGMPSFSASVNLGIFYNNRRGLGLEAGVSGELTTHKLLSLKNKDEQTFKDTVKGLSLSGGLNLNSQNGMGLSGGFAIYNFNKNKLSQIGLSTSVDYNSRQGLTDMKIGGEFNRYKEVSKNLAPKSNLPLSTNISFARSTFVPSIRIPITRMNQTYTLKLGRAQWGLFANAVISGYVNESRIAENDRVQRKPAYGYMYYEEGKDNKNGLMDFNRMNDGVYTYKRPVISLPAYTYDVFTINGEGTGGSFRGYRGNIGNVRDNQTDDKTSSLNIALDLGAGRLFHGGTTIGGVYSPSQSGEWKSGNALRNVVAFKPSDKLFQGFYFKNPGEKAIIDESFYNNVGGDQLIRPFLQGINSATPYLNVGYQVFDKDRKVERVIPVSSNTIRGQRDKRTQVITYLTATEATDVGLDQFIYSYKENRFKPGDCAPDDDYKVKFDRYKRQDPTFYRKSHHISEVDVLEADGRRYVYGIPVYQIRQKEVTFSTDRTPESQLVPYTAGTDNSVKNSSGLDGSFQSQELGGYAHSFLLTGILSPDYVDVTGNGITDDDLGSAVKFNYSRVNRQKLAQGNYWKPFGWRMPLETGKANFNEGLKTDSKDNKALYTYGEKELWYMHSLESKNMVATFSVSARNDGYPFLNEDGGVGTDTSANLKKLDQINLYTKAEFASAIKNGRVPRPVKTVHFEYNYQLCPSYPLNKVGGAGGTGKLTLVAVWFSYNGNLRQKKNKYQFKYSSGDKNPAYNSSQTDRWGTYKRESNNPQDNSVAISNADYPYTLQDPVSDDFAGAWNLEKILTPSGATMAVTYEADDYAYVQDKPASQMTRMVGFGFSKDAAITSNTYTTLGNANYNEAKESDNRFVFFEANRELASDAEVKELFLKGFNQLLLRIWVEMPRGNPGSSPAYEPVTVYGKIKSSGRVSRENLPDYFYVELEPTHRGGSPIMETVVQFLKDQLPQRAYPGYNVKDGSGLTQLVSAVWGMFTSLVQGVMGFEKTLKMSGSCRKVDMDRSFARINSTTLKKKGGGHRVKRIVISDNWSILSSRNSVNPPDPGLPDSYYGQVYDYTTTEVVNNQVISASSGVATYEPGIGNEENPFREVLQYSESQFLGPTDHSNIELPLAETFFPSPMVGYSKVTVKSIHNKSDKRIKSGMGMQETEFFTTRDFPVITDFTNFDHQSRKQYKPPFINQVLNFNKKDYVTLTQGFRIILNDMNGKMKAQTSYPENDYKTIINSTRYYYRTVQTGNNKYKLDNILPVVSGPDGKITNKLIGKEVEVMNDFREHFSYTYAKQIPLNLDVFGFPPFLAFIPSIFRMGFRDESLFRSATTLKVINEYGILDSVVNNDKGSIVSTKNLVYDAETGDVLLTRTKNEFKKPVYQFNYPAWWTESGMEPAYRNIDLTYKNVLFRNGRIEESPHVDMANFESGDELYVLEGTIVNQSAGCIVGGDPPFLPLSNEKRIWALFSGKDVRNTSAESKQFIFLDRHGNPYNARGVTLRIIRSGKRNLTGTSVGSIVSQESPIHEDGNIQHLVFDNTTNVINASAMRFEEKWRASEMFYTKDTTLTVVRQAPLHTTTLRSTNTYTVSEYHAGGTDPEDTYFYYMANPASFIGRQKSFGRSAASSHHLSRSFALFDLTEVGPSATIVSAKLALKAHRFDVIDQTQGVDHRFDDDKDGHKNTNPHYRDFGTSNQFRINRTLSSWPADNNHVAWKNMYSAEGGETDLDQKIISQPATNTQNYELNSTTNADSRIDITSMFRGMIRDKYDPAKNYAPALRIKIVNDGDLKRSLEKRVCFWAIDAAGGHLSTAPRIFVEHYNCAEAYGLPGNPSTPPVGQPTVPCVTKETITMCLSVFGKKQMNPYIEGVLGNWRPLQSYVFYGERRESDVAVKTDISKDGVIKNFTPYWVMTDGVNPKEKLGSTSDARWVWNSVITQYNRKGAELENHDALNRYNAGIYGYQETLPIAVVNNSRLRLSAYDGFEDYDYEDTPCGPFCNPHHRHFTTGITPAALSSAEAHTGKYSFKVSSGLSFDVPLQVSEDDPEPRPDVRIKMLKNPYLIYTLNMKGIGLKGYYYDVPYFGLPGTANPVTSRVDEYVYLNFRGQDAHDGNGCIDHGNLPPQLTKCNNISVKWKGLLQVDITGNYLFNAPGDDQRKVFINGATVLDQTYGGSSSSTPIHLTRGQLYNIEVQLFQASSYGSINLLWRKPNPDGTTNPTAPFTTIPSQHFYPEGQESLADGSYEETTIYCEKPDTIQAINHHLVDSLNLIPGKKMVASMWVKKGGPACQCASYTGLNMSVKTSTGTILANFVPKERVIEGWQQFEAVFDVPLSTNDLKLEWNAPSNVDLFIDDLRLHPFNANMKSFVYDPVTLRLAAELDENNFATFYEYDDEGTPARVKKETRQGVKTITETRSSLQKNTINL